MAPLGISQNRLARDLGIPAPRVNAIVQRKRSITADTALRLGKYFEMEPEFWLNLQARYDLEREIDLLGDRLDIEVRTRIQPEGSCLPGQVNQEDYLPIVVERLVSGFDPLQIILFGSLAKGSSSRFSDVDLLVIMPEGTDRHGTEVAMLTALGDLPIAKDIFVIPPSTVDRYRNRVGHIVKAALRDGKVLYDRVRAS